MEIRLNKPLTARGTVRIPRTKDRGCKAVPLHQLLSSYQPWKDRVCFIIGGGPSLRGFDYSRLQGHHTLGINKAFLAYPCEMLYCMDYTFYDKVAWVHKDPDLRSLHEAWQQYKGIKIFLRNNKEYRYDPSVSFIPSVNQKTVSENIEAGIYPGSNSGHGAISLAIALGSRRIGLLGYDMTIDTESLQTHWHNGYKGQDAKDLQKKLAEFRQSIEEFVPWWDEMSISIVNLNPHSGLRCFPFDTVEGFLNAHK